MRVLCILLLLIAPHTVNAQYASPTTVEQFPRHPHRLELDLEFDWSRTSADSHAWRRIILLQTLDIATTLYAVHKYSCLREQNPLLPARPELDDLVSLKLLVTVPLYLAEPTEQDLKPLEFITAIVVVNNLDQIARARRLCD